jgi:hypothetical protein
MKRRLRGFSKINGYLSTTHSSPSHYWLIHMAWDYLTPSDRYHVALQSPPFEAYAHLR